MFFMLKVNGYSMIKVDCNLTYERIENNGSLDFFESRFVCENIFCDFCDYLHVFCVF